MSKGCSLVVVRRLVPYHDARFAAAARLLELEVIETRGEPPGEEWSADCRATRNYSWKSLGAHGRSARKVNTRAQLLRVLEHTRPSAVIVQGWSDGDALVAAEWAVRNQKGTVVLSESNYFDHSRRWFPERVKAELVSNFDAALVGGRCHKDYLIRLGLSDDRICLGYNVVDNVHFRAGRKFSGSLDSRSPYFLVVSRLVGIKNLDTAIRAFAQYQRALSGKGWDLVILGKGELEDDLKSLSSDLGVSAKVNFAGFAKYEDLPTIYGGAGALVHPAREEPWGLVVNEAMASGIPVIVSSKCGSAELVEDGRNGFLFSPDDEKRLALVMEMISKDGFDIVEMGSCARKSIDKCGPEYFAEGLREAVGIARTRANKRSFTGILALSLASRMVQVR